MEARRLVFGVGISDIPTSYAKNGKWPHFKFYKDWVGMIRRCYCPKTQAKQDTYVGCEVTQEWHTLSAFKAWYDRQTYRQDGWQIDKDYLAPAMPGKLYSPSTCCYVPQWLNSLFIDSGKIRGEWPLGVCFDKQHQQFKAQLNVDGGRVHLGRYGTPEEAYEAYVNAKADYALGKLEGVDMPADLKARVQAGIERQLEKLLESVGA